MKTAVETSREFWKALEEADTKTMREICDPDICFVHIGVTCGLEEEMRAFDEKIFQPTEIVIHDQKEKVIGDDTAIVISDVDYGLLLGGKPTTHHFAVTEVYRSIDEKWKLVQFSFTALTY